MSTPARITLDQYDIMVGHGAFDEEHRQRVELIHGEIREMNSAGTSQIARITLDQYDIMVQHGAFDGEHQQRVELIHGEIREMNPIGPEHEVTVAIFTEWSFGVLPRHQAWVRVQCSIRIPELKDAPEPDITWVARKNYSSGRPSPNEVFLLVEVAHSSLLFDLGEKANLYAQAEIQDYWVVNLPEQCVEVFRDPEGGRYGSRQSYRGEEEVRPLAFSEIVLKPSTLFSGAGES